MTQCYLLVNTGSFFKAARLIQVSIIASFQIYLLIVLSINHLDCEMLKNGEEFGIHNLIPL